MTILTAPEVPTPDGINPTRARCAVRTLYAGPTLTAADLSAPLLALPDEEQVETSLPGAVPLSGISETVTRWAGLGIQGVKVFAYGHDRDGRATGALLPGNRMVRAIEQAKAAAPDRTSARLSSTRSSRTPTGPDSPCPVRTGQAPSSRPWPRRSPAAASSSSARASAPEPPGSPPAWTPPLTSQPSRSTRACRRSRVTTSGWTRGSSSSPPTPTPGSPRQPDRTTSRTSTAAPGNTSVWTISSRSSTPEPSTYMLPQVTWPDDHQPRVDGFLERLPEVANFRATPMRWASGLVVAARL